VTYLALLDDGVVEYHVGFSFAPKEDELVVIDEGDALIFEDPSFFRGFIAQCACICLTATPDDDDPTGVEAKVISTL